MAPRESEQIWYRDPVGAFLSPDTLARILPQPGTPLTEQLNALMRFALYFGVIASLFRQSPAPAVYVVAVAGALTAALHYQSEQGDGDAERRETMARLDVAERRGALGVDEFCTVPTKDNPFMNVRPSDYGRFPDRPEACDASDPDVRADIHRKFDSAVFRDTDDVYGRHGGSSRQFYTMPVTTVPNAQIEFAHWLYREDDADGSCRDGDAMACQYTRRNPMRHIR